jgi:hypothetical protein
MIERQQRAAMLGCLICYKMIGPFGGEYGTIGPCA